MKVLIASFVILELILPMGCASYLMIVPPVNSSIPAGWNEGLRFWFFLGTLPCYAVYAWLLVKEHFPERLREAWPIFVPVLISLGLSLSFWPEDNLLDFLIFEGLPFYLGLNLTFCIGLAIATYQHNAPKIDLTLILLWAGLNLALFSPSLIVFAHGWALSADLELRDQMLAQGEYLLSIVLAAGFSWPMLKHLHEQGEL